MRPKKDPGLRQDAFILASTQLFMEKGYEDVSVREILDAVADRTASPSVFYYYFPSKDALYRACVETVAQAYLSRMQEGFSPEGKTAEQWMLSLVAAMEDSLRNEKNLLLTGASTGNRLFILDMREQVTDRIAVLWAESLAVMFAVPNDEARSLARFLSGGISEMMFDFIKDGVRSETDIRLLSDRIVRFVMNTLGCPDEQKAQLSASLQAMHENL